MTGTGDDHQFLAAGTGFEILFTHGAGNEIIVTTMKEEDG